MHLQTKAAPKVEAAAGWAAPKAASGRRPTPTEKRHAGVARPGIEKKNKKKEARGMGLMRKAMAVDAPPVEEEEEEVVAGEPSPYIVDKKNPFDALGAMMDAEEAEAALAAKKAAEAAKPDPIRAVASAVVGVASGATIASSMILCTSAEEGMRRIPEPSSPSR